VRDVNGSTEPWRSRFSRTRRETRFLRQETPYHVHRSVVMFHEVSLLDVSEDILNASSGWKSGFFVA
jgi:uncharacterized protein (DUF2461 family)